MNSYGIQSNRAVYESVYEVLSKQFLKSAFLGALFIAISSQLSVRFGLIPFTLQTSAIFLVVYKLGVSRGVAAVLMYLMEGALGLPVFQSFSGGIAVLSGPTGGYLLGFVPMAYVFGSILERSAEMKYGRSFLFIIFAEIIAMAVDYIFGYVQLLMFMSPSAAYAVGVAPFLVSGAMKMTIVAVSIKAFWSIEHKNI